MAIDGVKRWALVGAMSAGAWLVPGVAGAQSSDSVKQTDTQAQSTQTTKSSDEDMTLKSDDVKGDADRDVVKERGTGGSGMDTDSSVDTKSDTTVRDSDLKRKKGAGDLDNAAKDDARVTPDNGTLRDNANP